MLAFVGRFAHIPVLLLVIWPPLETLALQDLKQFVLLVLRRDPVEDEEALTWTRATLHAASGRASVDDDGPLDRSCTPLE